MSEENSYSNKRQKESEITFTIFIEMRKYAEENGGNKWDNIKITKIG